MIMMEETIYLVSGGGRAHCLNMLTCFIMKLLYYWCPYHKNICDYDLHSYGHVGGVLEIDTTGGEGGCQCSC